MRTQLERLGAALSVAAVLAAPVLAQQPQAEFTEQLEVTDVLLDVLVTDSNGNVILGLDKDDFVVEEAGQPVELNEATFYSNRRFVDAADVAGRLGIDKEQVPVDRYFILFFHDQRALDPSLIRSEVDAVRRAKEWVTQELLLNDYVAVLSYDAKLQLHQDFTTDNAAILRALDEVAKGKDPGSVWASRTDPSKGPSLAANLPQGRELSKATRRIYSALEETAKAAGYVTGRKNLMFFSVGFGEPNELGGYLPDERYYGRMMQALNDNNVAVYAISWLENLSEELPGWDSMANGMSLLASDTGGRYYFNFVDFKDPLVRVTEDNGGYYLLSYSAKFPVGTEGYRKVTVKTVNPNFVVRARQGYSFGP